MAFELISDKRQRPRRWPWLEIVLIFGFFGCLLVGAGALFGIFLLEDVDSFESLTEINEISTEIQMAQITPQLALMNLAGDPVDALFKQALSAEQLETAYTTLLFETRLTHGDRVSMLLQLAKKFGQDAASLESTVTIQNAVPFQNTTRHRTIQLYRLARSILILDTTISPLERSRLLIQCTEGLLAVDQREDALETATQAMNIGEKAPDLLPAQRNQIFNALQPIGQQLNDAFYTRKLNELLRNPYIAATGSLLAGGWTMQLDTLSEPLVIDGIVDATTTRQQAARALAERLIFTGGVDVEPERLALAQALLIEDQLRQNHYQQSLTAALTLEERFQVSQEQSAWLLLKNRITLGGFGFQIVPEWEGSSELTEQDLTGVMTQIRAVLDVFANDQSTPIEQSTLRVESLMWLALQHELGFYPNLSPEELHEQLRASQVEMGRLGTPLALPVGYDAQSSFPGFRIQELR